MSSSQNNKSAGKMTTSISQRIAFDHAMKRLGLNLGFDLTTVALIVVGYMLYGEYFRLGEIRLASRRWLTFGENFLDMTYHVSAKGDEVLTLGLHNIILGALVVAGVFMILQIIGTLAAIPRDSKKIREALNPINEVAIKAEELSKLTFDVDKYQEIEEAISNVKFNAEKPLDIGDADLQGIEAALNNMLIKLRESYEKQARFVNDASHELRTPIAVIDGYANMLARWGKEDEKILDEGIAAIQHESKHMEYLVNQLLFLARGDAGRMRFELKEVSLNDLMQEVYEESLMIDENHPYRYQKPDQDIKLEVDEGLLKQAVRILVDNSSKYTKEHDEIILSVGYNENKRPYLQVQDTGIGMAEADVEHMFERFYRADEARTYNGTGLGLSIAKWIVDKHKGHFEITSRTNLGTRIRIVL